MTHDRTGKMLFVGAVGVGCALYALTAPDGLPWNGWTHLALAYLGEIVPLPAMPYPVWGFHVQAFGGPVALAIILAALAAGLLAAVVNRYLGWRFAAAGRIIVMDGLCDDQIQREAARGGAAAGLRTVAMRHDDAYRSNLVAGVRSAFPDETDLHVAAQIGPEAFVAAAGHAPALAKLGEYAVRRGAWVEAFRWFSKAKEAGMRRVDPMLRQIRTEWAMARRPEQRGSVSELFTEDERTAAYARLCGNAGR